MASFMKEYEHLKIQLKDIKLATNDFHEKNVIGNGGFGKVYEGELCHSQSEKKSLVALKRLDHKYGQGDPQFWKEIMMLFQYRHQNLISLLGYCIKEGEMIIIYEHASRGSLERYLNDVTLTWAQRIKICLDAAKGISFLYEPNKRKQRVQLQVFEEYKHILESASQSLAYGSLVELKQILRIGIHLKDYTTWFSLNEKGEHSVTISIKDCLIPIDDFPSQYKSYMYSRFPASIYETKTKGFKTHVKTDLLSPLLTYTVNLVFRNYCPEKEYIDFKYRLKGETTTSTVKLANKRTLPNYLYISELCQFNSDGNIVDIEIDFEDHRKDIEVEGISFEPLEKVEDQVSKDKVEIPMPQL
uniref:Protein kinase-like domain, phloem protein 2-like protein n=1 Tax=Tanacetum cinerariifolium TaxID=118510 RepID=A0A6L2LB07_TANCI|nr:protein kinase-like domain, phloem protein 2-like protein [Tanacetum cinerariifolium]